MTAVPVLVPLLVREDTRGIRALAESLLAADHPGLRDLPAPVQVRVALASNARVREYVLGWARHPQTGGTFDARTRWLRRLPGSWLLQILTALGYDGIVYATDDTVIGHVFYQRHGADAHGFSVAVDAAHEGRGYSHVMLMDFLTFASRQAAVRRARLGRARNNVTRAALDLVRKEELRLGWRVSDDGWVSFSGD
jgi:hypothetical protein